MLCPLAQVTTLRRWVGLHVGAEDGVDAGLVRNQRRRSVSRRMVRIFLDGDELGIRNQRQWPWGPQRLKPGVV